MHKQGKRIRFTNFKDIVCEKGDNEFTMNDNRLVIEESIFLASLKLERIHWEVVRESHTNVILNQIHSLQRELEWIKKSIKD